MNAESVQEEIVAEEPDEIVAEDSENGQRMTVKTQGPQLPTIAERLEHEMTHVPY